MQWLVVEHGGVKRVVPFSADALECVKAAPAGTVFYGVLDRPRSQKQHKLYWAALDHVVAATGKWASSEALHQWCKKHTGTASLADLGHSEFQRYFRAAMLCVTEAVGYDPVAELKGYEEL